MEKYTKQMKQAKAKAEEQTLNRVLCWMAGGAVLEFLLLILKRYYINYTAGQIGLRVALGTAVKVVAVLALVGAVAAGMLWNNGRKAGQSKPWAEASGLFLAGMSLSCFVTWGFSSAGLRLMTLVIPAIVVLGMIYFLYQHEFFLLTTGSCLGLLGIWICSRSNGGSYSLVGYGYCLAAVAVLLAVALLCRKAEGGKGLVEWKGKSYKLLSGKSGAPLIYVGSALTVAVLAGAMFGAPSGILYAAQVAWLLIMAVYHTIKLM